MPRRRTVLAGVTKLLWEWRETGRGGGAPGRLQSDATRPITVRNHSGRCARREVTGRGLGSGGTPLGLKTREINNTPARADHSNSTGGNNILSYRHTCIGRAAPHKSKTDENQFSARPWTQRMTVTGGVVEEWINYVRKLLYGRVTCSWERRRRKEEERRDS